jgi:hypothetical protein
MTSSVATVDYRKEQIKKFTDTLPNILTQYIGKYVRYGNRHLIILIFDENIKEWIAEVHYRHSWERKGYPYPIECLHVLDKEFLFLTDDAKLSYMYIKVTIYPDSNLIKAYFMDKNILKTNIKFVNIKKIFIEKL